MQSHTTFLRVFSGIFLLLAVLEVMVVHSLQPLDNRLSDFFVRQYAQDQQPDPDIVLINIDDASLAKMEEIAGKWPWPRAVHGELINGIAQQGPKAIVFDLSFVERDVYRPESDALFNQALADKPPIYFPMARLPEKQDAAGPALAQIAPMLGIMRGPHAIPDAHAALMPPLAIAPQYWRVGTNNFSNDADGVGRRYQLYTDVYGWLLPSLPARVASDLGYPVPQQADMVLSWRGKSGAYQRISYADLYQDFSRAKPLRKPFELRDKIIIIGTDATDMHDIRVTPIASLYPGVEILATAIDNLKNHSMMHVISPWLSLIFSLTLLAILYLQFAVGWHALKVGAGFSGVSLMCLMLSYLALRNHYLILVLTPLFLGWIYYLCWTLQEYLRVRRAQLQTVQLFSRFVNPHVVKVLVANETINRAGESRTITVLFSDIRGFTSLSENRSPQEIVQLLNRYFTLQVAVIFKHGGSLDKFIGDSIMAFWGAPLDDTEHAQHAVDAALEMAQVLQSFKQELGEQDLDFDIGIGIHSGPAVVGLIGSEQRKEYTAIGDTVNLASRIEGLTKEVAPILVSLDTMQLCTSNLDFHPAGSYKVKGREKEVTVFIPSRRDAI